VYIYSINFEGHDEWIESGYAVKFSKTFGMLDIRTQRGFALQTITRKIRDWHAPRKT
jgi:hypothetical protein